MIFAFSAFSSAFGGILAYGLTQIRTDNFSGWRWLFAIEGAMTFVIVPCFYFVFPKSPTEAWFLTAEEKQMMQARYDADPSWGNDEEFSWAECFKAFKDPKWWAFWAYQFSVNISLYGLTTFLPTIVRGLGYTSVHANLMTVPIYICSLLFFLVIAYFSDRTQMRGPYLLGCLMCLIIGYAILISVESLKVRFFACFRMFSSLSPCFNVLTSIQLPLLEFIQQPVSPQCGCRTMPQSTTSEPRWSVSCCAWETQPVSPLDRSSLRPQLPDTFLVCPLPWAWLRLPV
jgi:MFS family permease